MERRSFLQAGAGALAAAAALPATAQTESKVTPSVMLWTLKGSFEDKLECAAHAGCKSVELVAEHAKWSDAEAQRMKRLAESLGLKMDTILASPDWGSRPVSMVRPEQRDAMLADVRTAIEWSKKLDIPQIIMMGGNEVPGKSYQEQWDSLVEGSKRAAEIASKSNAKLIFEPLNSKVNHKGYFLTTCVEGLKLVKAVDNPHFRLLFDIYHEQVQIGNVTRTAVEAMPFVAVYHIADNPGRNDPGTGEMNYAKIYDAIRKTGYSGYVTMEYLPVGDQKGSLRTAVGDMLRVFGA
jgi:hydroxypyruvate isomerase